MRTVGVFLEECECGRDWKAFAASFTGLFDVGYWGEMRRAVDGVTVGVLFFLVVVVRLVRVIIVDEILRIRFECEWV